MWGDVGRRPRTCPTSLQPPRWLVMAAKRRVIPTVPLQAIVRLWVAGGGDSAGRITPPDRPGTPSSLAQPALAQQESNGSLSSACMVSPESSMLGRAADPLQHAQRRRRMRAIQLAVKWNRPLVVEAIFSEAAQPRRGQGNRESMDSVTCRRSSRSRTTRRETSQSRTSWRRSTRPSCPPRDHASSREIARDQALQYALELRRYDVIRLLMGYQGFSLQFVNLCKLYLVPNGGLLDSDSSILINSFIN